MFVYCIDAAVRTATKTSDSSIQSTIGHWRGLTRAITSCLVDHGNSYLEGTMSSNGVERNRT